jgi:hypothetical protein
MHLARPHRILWIFCAYGVLQIWAGLDPVMQGSWVLLTALGALASSGRELWTRLFELALWLRLATIPPLYFHWGSAPDVLAPGLACLLFAYVSWTLAGRSRRLFLLPAAVVGACLVYVRLAIFDVCYPEPLLAARVSGGVAIRPVSLPRGWSRFHCPGYSIGVAPGMTSACFGNSPSNIFAYHQRRPPGEVLSAIATMFPRPTAFSEDPNVAPMAGQLLGLGCEYDYALHVLNSTSGVMFLNEKMSWLGLSPPEKIEQLSLDGARGFLLSEPRVNSYRVRLFFDVAGVDHQTDLWLYGDGPLLTRERVLAQLATVQVEPHLVPIPSLDACRDLVARGADLEANIALNSLLARNCGNWEALYMLARNQENLARAVKAGEILRRLDYFCKTGEIPLADFLTWQRRYGSIRAVMAR